MPKNISISFIGIKPILLKELCEEIAPIIQVIFERSIQTRKLSAEGCQAQGSPIFKKVIKLRLQITDQSPSPVFSARSLNI